MNETMSPIVQIEQLDGDDTVLCCIVQARHKTVVVINTPRYPHALEHARQHIAAGFDSVLICGPECDGTQR